MRFRVARRTRFPYALLFIVICILFANLLLFNKQPAKGDIVTLAKHYLGVPYRFGGSAPAGFDCSGYIMFLFQQYGKDLPRTADRQATVGKPVSVGQLQPGDVVFFATDSKPGISHTGLYIGNQQFIHASSTAKKIIISNLQEPYWQKVFQGARRMMQ